MKIDLSRRVDREGTSRDLLHRLAMTTKPAIAMQEVCLWVGARAAAEYHSEWVGGCIQ